MDILEKEIPQESNCYEDCDRQQMSYQKRRELVSLSCPYLGLKEIDRDWLDGVEDLADILGDLQRVKWCLDDAKWHYHFYYYSHFQEHIRSIRKILKSSNPRGRSSLLLLLKNGIKMRSINNP